MRPKAIVLMDYSNLHYSMRLLGWGKELKYIKNKSG